MKRKAPPKDPSVVIHWGQKSPGRVAAYTHRQQARAQQRARFLYFDHVGAITPSRSVRSRKRAIFAARKLRPCDHEYELQTAGGGGCDQFPEPISYYLQCCMCGKEAEATHADLHDDYSDHTGEYDGFDSYYRD